MAKRLVENNFTVEGFDIRKSAVEESGIAYSSSIAQACTADAVFLSLPSSREVENTFKEKGGILDSGKPGLVVVDMTTSEAHSTQKLYSLAEKRGISLVDAPISGGPEPADSGKLTIMVGGSEEAIRHVRPVLEKLGSTIYYLGESGNGHAAKTVNNFLNAVNLAATAEAMVLGVQYGLDPSELRSVINNSSGRNWASEVRFEHILAGNYQEGALKTNLMKKDLDVYLTLAEAQEAPTFLAKPALDVYKRAAENGHGEKPANYVVDFIGDLAGGIRMQKKETTKPSR